MAEPARGTAEAQVSLLREYRTRMIADVVTGKLDVREAAAQLTDEPEEARPTDEAEPVDDASGFDSFEAEDELGEIEA